jgi:hypothetical protein
LWPIGQNWMSDRYWLRNKYNKINVSVLPYENVKSEYYMHWYNSLYHVSSVISTASLLNSCKYVNDSLFKWFWALWSLFNKNTYWYVYCVRELFLSFQFSHKNSMTRRRIALSSDAVDITDETWYKELYQCI